MTEPEQPEPSEVDRALVAREIERLTALAGPKLAGEGGTLNHQRPEHVFYMGWVAILTELGVTEAAAHLRAEALNALKGVRPVRVMEPAPRRGGWLAQLDDELRQASTVRKLNRARRSLGLPLLRQPILSYDEATARNMTGRENWYDY